MVKGDAMFRYLLAVMTLLVGLPVFTSAQCRTTHPPNPQFVPPKPYPQDAPSGTFWYGTESLRTGLSADGEWGGLHNDKGYRQKVFFWTKGYDARREPKPKLTITGRRLDADSPSIEVADADNAFVGSNTKLPPAMVTAFEIPTAGCWELTAHYGGRTLTFIVSVKP
ncbi:MAG: hypothetical protein WB723_18135 [Candidatus Acidiferrales bacterium]